ncbi:MAG: hypothetical protein NVSMB38_44760 [Ktedonobacteraceae bacterium]
MIATDGEAINSRVLSPLVGSWRAKLSHHEHMGDIIDMVLHPTVELGEG